MCMVITVCCSASIIVSYLIGKFSIGKCVSYALPFQYIIMIRMLDCEMETEMVVGWFEVEL